MAAVVRARGRCLTVRVTAKRHGIKGHPQAPQSGPREVVVGIDLGTTNSAVAVIEAGRPRCLPNPHGSTLTPSVVTFLEGGEVAVGRDAKRMVATAPTLTFSSVKRLIGRKFDDPVVQEDIPRLPYKVCAHAGMRGKTCGGDARHAMHACWCQAIPAHPCPRAKQVGQDADGNVTLLCSTVERGFIYPEEVAAQVRPHSRSREPRFFQQPVFFCLGTMRAAAAGVSPPVHTRAAAAAPMRPRRHSRYRGATVGLPPPVFGMSPACPAGSLDLNLTDSTRRNNSTHHTRYACGTAPRPHRLSRRSSPTPRSTLAAR
jgi:hypothetical protein